MTHVADLERGVTALLTCMALLVGCASAMTEDEIAQAGPPDTPASEAGGAPGSGIVPPKPHFVDPGPAPQPRPGKSWSQLSRSGRDHLRFGRLAEAETDLFAAYALSGDFRPRDPRRQTSIRNLYRLARASLEAGRTEDFARVTAQLVDLTDRQPDQATIELADLLADLAAVRVSQERYGEALEAARRALAIRTEETHETDASRVPLLSQIGLIELELENPEEARRQIDRALEVAIAARGDADPLYAQALIARARWQFRQGQMDEAEQSLQNAVAIYVRTYGEESRMTAPVVRELAVFYDHAGRIDEARGQLERVVEIWEASTGERLQRALARNELAWLLVRTGKPAEAVEPASDALELLQLAKVFGAPRAAVLDTLATSYRDQKRYDDAEPYYREALELAAGSPQSVEIAERYAELLRLSGRPDEATSVMALHAGVTPRDDEAPATEEGAP